MARYAEGTTVDVVSSRIEIERTISRYGASSFAYAIEGARATVAFKVATRTVRFVLPLPDPDSDEFTRTPARGLPRTEKQRREAWEQACRQRWRALALAVKAKLETVESGIATFDDEFLAYLVLPEGDTVAERLAPELLALDTGSRPAQFALGSGS